MVLKRGSKGEKVVILQQFLGLKQDGDFGPVTEKAVKKWQQENGLLPDGIVGPNTRTAYSRIVSIVDRLDSSVNRELTHTRIEDVLQPSDSEGEMLENLLPLRNFLSGARMSIRMFPELYFKLAESAAVEAAG